MAIFTGNNVSQLAGSADMEKIKSYLFQNNELLRYMFSNLNPEDNYSPDAYQKYLEIDGKMAEASLTAKELRVSMKNLKEETESQLKITSEQIALKVSKGEISSQLSIEPGTVTFNSNRLIINSTNFKLDAKGNATFKGIVTGSEISGGSIDVGVLYADDESVWLGDWYVSADGSNVFSAVDDSVKFQTAAGGPFGKYAVLKLTSESGTTIVSDHHVETSLLQATARVLTPAVDGYDPDDPRYSTFYDINLGRSWWDGDSITDTVRELWESCDGVSDERAKFNIESIDPEEAMTFLMSSNPVTFQYKRDGKWSAGFIAQEIDAIMDEYELYYPLVGTDHRSGLYKVDYRTYIPLLVAAVQNLQVQINELRGMSNG